MGDETDKLAREFWSAVFLQRVQFYRSRGWDDSTSACAAKDADGALKEWRERWDKKPALGSREIS